MKRSIGSLASASTLGIVLAACGGTVVFEEDGGGDGGRGGGAATTSTSNTSNTSIVSTGQGPITSVGLSTGVGPSTGVGTGVVGTGVGQTAIATGVGPSASSGFGDGSCGYDVTFFDGARDDCGEATCCPAFDACTDFGADSAGCQSCLDGSGSSQCSAALSCIEDSSCWGGFCDDWLDTGDPGLDACLDGECCVDILFCIGANGDTDACNNCLENGGGPLCDRFIACAQGCDAPPPPDDDGP